MHQNEKGQAQSYWMSMKKEGLNSKSWSKTIFLREGIRWCSLSSKKLSKGCLMTIKWLRKNSRKNKALKSKSKLTCKSTLSKKLMIKSKKKAKSQIFLTTFQNCKNKKQKFLKNRRKMTTLSALINLSQGISSLTSQNSICSSA